MGITDLEDAFERLEKLSHDEALMATAQVLKATHHVDEKVQEVIDGAQGMFRLFATSIINVDAPSWKGNKCSGASNRELSR